MKSQYTMGAFNILWRLSNILLGKHVFGQTIGLLAQLLGAWGIVWALHNALEANKLWSAYFFVSMFIWQISVVNKFARQWEDAFIKGAWFTEKLED